MILFKKTVSWLMALIMVFSVTFTNSAMAIESTSNGEATPVAIIGTEEFKTLQDAVNAANGGETVTLLSDVEMSNILVIDKSITLDGNGKTLTSTANRAINVSGADGVKIKNLTIKASGERAINVIQNATNLSIENVTATAANYTINVASSAPGAVIRIKDSTLTGLCTVNVSADSADVELTDSTINCNDYNKTEGESYAALALNKEAANGKIAANGCTINVAADSDSVAAKNLAENGTVTIDGSSEDVTIISVVITYEGSPYYHGFATLEKAIEFAKPGDTVTLIRDVKESKIITIDKAITLDGNGKTLTSTANRAINVSGADGVKIKNLTIKASGERAINVIQNATNLSIENVTATAANYTINVASSAPGAVIRIKDSTLTGLCTVNVSADSADVELTNSTINCNDYNKTEGESYAALALNKEAANGKIAANGCTINVAADSDSVAAKNLAENGTVTIDGSSEDVTIISVVITYEGSPYYHGFATLEKAIEFAKPGDTVTLIRDVKESEIITIDKAITLDLNGKTADAEFELTGYAASLIAPEGLNIKSGIKGHNIIYKNGIYTIDAEHNFGNKWYSDDKEHWQICDCGKTSDKAEHTWDSGKVTKKATCTQEGVTTYTCSNSECGKTKNEPIAAKGHSYSSSYTVDKKATVSANGSKSKHCRNCDAKKSVTVIYKISSVSLSDTHYTYNGETKKPAVTVKNSNGAVLKNGTDYSVSYQSGRKKIGRYKVSVTFKGEYSGNKALYFEIGPKNPSSVKAVLYGKDDVRVSWSKVEGATGYKVYYKRSSASEYTYLTKTTNTSIKKSGLADGVKYNFKVVAYKKADGNNCENAGKTASVYTLRKVKNVKAVKSNSKVKISWTNINGESGYQVSQSTNKSDTNIVATYKTTSGNSVKLKAKKGKTYYYKVRAYKTVDGKRIYAPWSDAVKFKLK